MHSTDKQTHKYLWSTIAKNDNGCNSNPQINQLRSAYSHDYLDVIFHFLSGHEHLKSTPPINEEKHVLRPTNIREKKVKQFIVTWFNKKCKLINQIKHDEQSTNEDEVSQTIYLDHPRVRIPKRSPYCTKIKKKHKTMIQFIRNKK